jgi:hypothetical protein
LNGTHQFLIYVDNVNLFGENTNNRKHPYTLFGTSKEVGLEINAGKISMYLLFVKKHMKNQDTNIVKKLIIVIKITIITGL